jgi:hypothetical protein
VHYPSFCLYLKTPSCLFFKTQCFGHWILSLEIGTGSIDWAQLSRFYLKTETECSLRNVVLKNKEDDVLADDLCCAWLVYPIWYWCRCPEIGTTSIEWTQLTRFYLNTETESSTRNVVFYIQIG